MVHLLASWLARHILAAPPPQGGAPQGGAPHSAFPLPFLGLMIAMIVFMIVMQRSSRKNEAKRRKELLDSLSKNDRVLTHGGIIGTIVNVKENEIVLKVDESTNTKMTFIKDAVRQIIKDPSELPTEQTPPTR